MRSPGRLLVICVGALLACVVIGCGQARSPAEIQRDTARATVTLVARAVAAGAVSCAEAIDRTQSKDLGLKCKGIYDTARSALLVSESGIDAWDAGSRDEVGCALRKATAALRELGEMLSSLATPPPTTLTDAVTFANRIGFPCAETP